MSQIIHGDCLEVLRGMADCSVDSIVTDPPYGLSFMGKKWDYDVPHISVWLECLRVLKPGGHLLAFAGTRTQHRMAVNIEDAGFEIRDMIAWVYGSGMPKSLDVSKAIDRAAGAERQVVGSKLGLPGYSLKANDTDEHNRKTYGQFTDAEKECAITAPATESAKQWQGWGTALKPALEPITLARKPLIGTVAANVLAHGTGAMNIDACRVPLTNAADAADFANNHAVTERLPQDRAGQPLGLHEGGWKQRVGPAVVPEGRWPANLIHDGSDEVVAAFPDAKGQQGALTGGEPSSKTSNAYGDFPGRAAAVPRGDAGSAARFFYCAKASKVDRDTGLEAHVDRVLARSCQAIAEAKRGNVVEAEAGAFNKARIRKNNHPTVKPTELMRYLCRLVTPPGGLVLDPFAGSGSTGKAALLEGFRFIGIEREAEYVEIARARVAAVGV